MPGRRCVEIGPLHVVCGFYTQDYAHWVERLVASLDRHRAPHDLVQVEKNGALWESNTLAKPTHILAAMRRHPGKVIIFVDVDCEVHGDLAPLTYLSGDIAFSIEAQRQRGRGVWLRVRSGTVVVNPTPRAEVFVSAWQRQCADADFGDDDETALARTVIGNTVASIQQLDRRWRAMKHGQLPDDMIVHDSASANLRKLRSAYRMLGRVIGRKAVA